MSRRTGVALTALLLSAVSGCATAGAAGTAPAPGASQAAPVFLQLDTYVPGGARLDALVTGTLRTERRGGAGCAWLDGQHGDRTYVVWPAGYRLRTADLVLVDGHGTVIGRPGARLTGGGGDHEGSGNLPGCGYHGDYWVMSPKD